MEYHFNKEIAIKYGMEEAVIIHNFVHWIEKNKANKKHLHQGTYWTYNSLSAFCELFPFWSKKQLERIVNSVIKQKLVIVGKFNEKRYDKTRWFAISDAFIFNCYALNIEDFTAETLTLFGEKPDPKRGDGCPQTVSPIPDSKTYSKQEDILKEDELKNSSATESIDSPLNTKKNKKEKKEASPIFCACRNFWLDDFHPGWTFGAVQGYALKGIITKLRSLTLQTRADCTDEDVIGLFKVLCNGMGDWFRDKDLQVINSKFNEIVEELKNKRNGKRITKNESQFKPVR